MAELYQSDAELNALSGTGDGEQEVLYVTTGESPYYTSFYKMLQRLLKATRRAGDLRVFKDGDLTFGVRAGKFFNGDTAVNYSQVTAQALTNNATNYIYLTAAGALTVNTTGFPTPSVTPHIPLATILTAAGVYDGRDLSEGGDVTDYRGRGFLTVCGSASGSINTLDWQESVADELDFTAAEPAAPTLGDRYLNTGTGASSVTAQTVAANDIEEWNGTTWTEITPTEGACCMVEDRDMVIGFNGAAWVDLGTFANIKDLTDGSDADTLHTHKLLQRTVEASTAGVGAPNVLTTAESRKVLTNEGSTAKNYHTLPTAAAGLTYTFIVQDTDGMRIVAAASDTIRLAGTISIAAGYIDSTTVGSTVTLVAINATEWVAVAINGTWDVETA